MCTKCPWALKSALEEAYHDNEWGVPAFDDRYIFEMLNLEGQQAGLSWTTILNKRAGMREVYHQFDPYILANLNKEDAKKYVLDGRLIKHELKINAVFDNARAYLKLIETHQSLSQFLWSFVDFKPIVGAHESLSTIPAQTELSETISKRLKKEGFKFVGPTTIYALMQAIGMVNDHLVECPSYKRVMK